MFVKKKLGQQQLVLIVHVVFSTDSWGCVLSEGGGGGGGGHGMGAWGIS